MSKAATVKTGVPKSKETVESGSDVDSNDIDMQESSSSSSEDESNESGDDDDGPTEEQPARGSMKKVNGKWP